MYKERQRPFLTHVSLMVMDGDRRGYFVPEVVGAILVCDEHQGDGGV